MNELENLYVPFYENNNWYVEKIIIKRNIRGKVVEPILVGHSLIYHNRSYNAENVYTNRNGAIDYIQKQPNTPLSYYDLKDIL